MVANPILTPITLTIRNAHYSRILPITMEVKEKDFTELTSALRRNTLPGLREQNAVLDQIDENNKLVASLKIELNVRLLKVEDAAASANDRAKSLDRVKQDLERVSKPPSVPVISLNPVGTVDTAPHGNTCKGDLQDRGGLFHDPYRPALTLVSPKLAQTTKEYYVAFEDHQDSLLHLDLAIKAVATVKEVISTIEKSNNSDRIQLKKRNMWKLPGEIWGQIFSEAMSLGKRISTDISSPPEEWERGTGVLVLSAVCQEWRSIANGMALLWSTLHVNPAAYSESALSMLVDLHIERMRSMPCTLVFRVEYSVPIPDGTGSWTKALQNLEELHHLHFQIYPSASSLVTELCEFLPPPRELTIESINSGFVPNVSLPQRIGTRMTNLSLFFSHVKEPCNAALTRIIFHHESTEAATTVAEWAPMAIQSLEHAVLLQSGDKVEPLEARITLPRLQYLETHLSYLINPFLSTFIVSNLSHLSLASINDESTHSWQDIAVQLGGESNLETLSLRSMDEYDVEVIVDSLDTLSSVTTLELYGCSVEPALTKLSELMESPTKRDLLRRLSTVVVSEYQGDGLAILACARVIANLSAPLIIQAQVEVSSCSNILRDVYQGLSELYQPVAN